MGQGAALQRQLMTELDEPSVSKVQHSAPQIGEEEIEAVARVLRSGHIAQGREVEASVRPHLIFGQGLRGVKFQDLELRHSNTTALNQSGAVTLLGDDLVLERIAVTQADGNGFDLNYIRAIGFTDFDETPFTGDRGSFRYHAVVGPPDGTFYDGTLALDGAGTPTAPPFTPLLAEGMLPDDYLFDLSSQWMIVGTSMDEKVEIQ